MPTDGLAFADRLLHRLLDRVETRPERRQRVIERMPVRSWLSDDREALHGRLEAAEAIRAVSLNWGKNENRHNLDAVILHDATKLYGFLGRVPPADRATAAEAELRSRLADLPSAFRPVLDAVVSGWAAKRNAIPGLDIDEPETVVKVFRAAAALLSRSLEGMDLRTFSRRVTGASKFVESNQAKIVGVLRRVEALPDYLDAEEVLAAYGVAKFPQPCLMAGPVTYRGEPLPTRPYIGVAPEMVSDLGVVGQPAWIMTIENLASFNRQVREAAGGGVVVYTGGFPSNATLAAILGLARATTCPVFHWGDIDPGGLKIAYRIERALAGIGRELHLHLMSPDIARASGQPFKPVSVFRADVEGSVVGPLARFLSRSGAHFLEQEELDPQAPAACVPPERIHLSG